MAIKGEQAEKLIARLDDDEAPRPDRLAQPRQYDSVVVRTYVRQYADADRGIVGELGGKRCCLARYPPRCVPPALQAPP
jgi:hypothetical protein